MEVREVMTTEVVVARPETSLPELVELMVTRNVTGLPVVDSERRVVGVVTEADLLARQAYTDEEPPRRLLALVAELLRGSTDQWAEKASGLTAGEIMTTPARTLAGWRSLRSAATVMLRHGVKRLPIVDRDGRLVGIVSRRDLLRLFHRSDDELADEVRRLLADPLHCPERHGVTLVDVDGGVVRLEGWTSTDEDAHFIERTVHAVPGVVDVRMGTKSRRSAGAA